MEFGLSLAPHGSGLVVERPGPLGRFQCLSQCEDQVQWGRLAEMDDPFSAQMHNATAPPRLATRRRRF